MQNRAAIVTRILIGASTSLTFHLHIIQKQVQFLRFKAFIENYMTLIKCAKLLTLEEWIKILDQTMNGHDQLALPDEHVQVKACLLESSCSLNS